MSRDLEDALRKLVRSIVREEVERALADVTRPNEYISTDVAAKIAEVTPATIRRWIRRGHLAPYHAGRELRISRADLEMFLGTGTRTRTRPVREVSPEEYARAYAAWVVGESGADIRLHSLQLELARNDIENAVDANARRRAEKNLATLKRRGPRKSS